MKFRTVISLKQYKHLDLIEALRDVVDGERGAYISDLAAEALAFKQISRHGLSSGQDAVEGSSKEKVVLITSATALQDSSANPSDTQLTKPPNPLAFVRPKRPT